jgi:hypothetical protein
MQPPPLSYSSTATPDDAVSTEGITFTLDDIVFTCHGRVSAFDLSEWAGPAADAGDDNMDIDAIRILADLMRSVLGDRTYRDLSAHRRKHLTPDSVMQQIVMDVVGRVAGRPSGRPLPSRDGPPEPAQPAAVSLSPASAPQPPARPQPEGRPLIGAAALARLAADGDIRFAQAPDAAATPRARRPATIRRIGPARQQVEVEEATTG